MNFQECKCCQNYCNRAKMLFYFFFVGQTWNPFDPYLVKFRRLLVWDRTDNRYNFARPMCCPLDHREYLLAVCIFIQMYTCLSRNQRLTFFQFFLITIELSISHTHVCIIGKTIFLALTFFFNLFVLLSSDYTRMWCLNLESSKFKCMCLIWRVY